MPAVRCDIDHTIDAAKGGETSRHNNAHLCRRHHVLKHATPWRVRQLPRGILEWTSPTGRIYTDHPPAIGDTGGPRIMSETTGVRSTGSTTGVRFTPDTTSASAVPRQPLAIHDGRPPF